MDLYVIQFILAEVSLAYVNSVSILIPLLFHQIKFLKYVNQFTYNCN